MNTVRTLHNKNSQRFTGAPATIGATSRREGGFTLIEVMVSVSIFTIVVLVGISSLLTVNNSFRRSQNQRAAIDNLSFATESIMREVRIGREYACSAQCSYFKFTTFDQDEREIFVDPDSNGVNRLVLRDNGQQDQYLTSDEITITDLQFIIEGNSPTDARQPIVYMSISAETTLGQQKTDFTIQTAVSQRVVDLVVTP